MTTNEAPGPQGEVETCPTCKKITPLCVCDSVKPLKNRVKLLILQHPQEQDKDLGTARLTALHFPGSVFKIGLSWPSLSKALGEPADPKRWAVLYLGSAKPSDFPAGVDVAALDKAGNPLPHQNSELSEIEGIVALDGTWSQAKTLWWRNAWMLKCKRVALRPRRASLYGKLRKEPRKEALSTLESVGMLLSRLERRADIETELLKTFEHMLDRHKRYQATLKQPSRPARAAGEL